MKPTLFPTALLLLVSMTSIMSFEKKAFAVVSANPAKAKSQLRQGSKEETKKVKKPLPILDRAWAMRSDSLMKKLAFVEQLQKELESQPHTAENKSRIQLSQAIILLSEKNTRLAAIELIRTASEAHPLNVNKRAVQLIWQDFVSKLNIHDGDNHNLLADVALALSTAGHDMTDSNVPFFLGIAEKNRANSEKAISHFQKTEPASPLYRLAKLNEGLLYAASGQVRKAKEGLEVVLNLEPTSAEKKAELSKESIINMREYAALNLARLMFEIKQFKEAIALYRTIDAQSELFYESLSEQGWAFFLAGQPNRALGAEYGASSPFFNGQFQPDLYFLKASVNYWLCDFNAAQKNIQAFVFHTKEDAPLLRKWTIANAANASEHRQILMRAYKVVEDLAHGVTSSNSMLGPRGIQTLARNKPVLKRIARLDEQRLLRQSIQKSQWPLRAKQLVVEAMLRREDKEQELIGRQSLSVIETMRADYERALLQVRVIHMEIMTAEKDRLMSQSRSAEGQQFVGSEAEFLEAAEQTSQLWSSDKREFWKDELDSFVFAKKSQCHHKEGEGTNHAEK